MAEERNENMEKVERKEIFSKAVRAGKRTYFFDVKTTKKQELYLTVTESKRKFDENGNTFYEKHKIFLYKEDFEKFSNGLNDVIDFITKNQNNYNSDENNTPNENKEFIDIDFDSLDD